MTVAELIAILQTFPPEIEVVAVVADGLGDIDIYAEPPEPTLVHMKRDDDSHFAWRNDPVGRQVLALSRA